MGRRNRLAIFDRDGTLTDPIPRGTYVTKIEELKLRAEAFETLVQVRDIFGWEVAVATNQPQVAKGLISREEVERMHTLMGAHLGLIPRKVYYCPHISLDQCSCRKPQPGMLFEAMLDLGFTPEETIMIGDSNWDIEAGRRAGCRQTIFIRHEHNEEELTRCEPDIVVSSLSEILEYLH